MLKELELPLFDTPEKVIAAPEVQPVRRSVDFGAELREFREFGERSLEMEIRSSDGHSLIPAFVNEFWTAGQRDADNLHEISYRACFKPQLPRFFIERLTTRDEVVYDPFMGRGTTLMEAALLGRTPAGNDVNPLSLMLIKPRLNPPGIEEIARRLEEIPWRGTATEPIDPLAEELLTFYHPETLREITSLKNYLVQRAATGTLDPIDEWIRMVALNRLTGHSPGFFSVYTLPPNQAVSVKSQLKINKDRNQTPPRRDVAKLILKKSRSLLKDLTVETQALLSRAGAHAQLVNAPAEATRALAADSISLVVTSPPFLDVVDYAGDNWLRCWFAGIDPKSVSLTVPNKLEAWQEAMERVFVELHRVLKPGGYIAFEVGEVRAGKVRLEETVITCGVKAGLKPVLVLINQQEFTKTANCWGVNNNAKGTNSNRIVLFTKGASAAPAR